MPVPGAFELPIGAMALDGRAGRLHRRARCVIRGYTSHFDTSQTRGERLQLAALEPESRVVRRPHARRADQARPGSRGAEAVRTASRWRLFTTFAPRPAR